MELSWYRVYGDAELDYRLVLAVELEMEIRGYNTKDYFASPSMGGCGIKIYCAVVDVPLGEFMQKYVGSRKITLGHMCEIEVPLCSPKAYSVKEQ